MIVFHICKILSTFGTYHMECHLINKSILYNTQLHKFVYQKEKLTTMLPVGKPRTKYLFGLGLKSLIFFNTYLADQSATLSADSAITNRIFVYT